MAKKTEQIMGELTKEIQALIKNYDVELITAVLDKELSKSAVEGAECIHTHLTHVGGRKQY